MIQGTQQIYIAFLWYWGALMSRSQSRGEGPPLSKTAVVAIAVPMAALLWVIGIVLFLGLPNYYRRRPGNVPYFYRSLYRRRTVLIFFFMVVLQNFFLSPVYNRNWKFLWR
jgi:alpha-1,3-glucan synthase